MPQPRGKFWEYVKTVLEQPPVKQPAPSRSSEAARVTPIPDSDGKVWFDLYAEGRFAVGVKVALESEAGKFLLGLHNEGGLQALRERVGSTSRHFAFYIREGLRLEQTENGILAFA